MESINLCNQKHGIKRDLDKSFAIQSFSALAQFLCFSFFPFFPFYQSRVKASITQSPRSSFCAQDKDQQQGPTINLGLNNSVRRR